MAGERKGLDRSRFLLAYLVVVVLAGAAIIAHSATLIHASSLNVYVLLLVALTIASGRILIKIPGRAATVSVSEVFIFGSIVLYGPAIPVLTVAIDGLLSSLTQSNRRLHRLLFNIAEPAISAWAAAHVFFAVAGVTPGSSLSTGMPILVPATLAMAGVFFVLNSGLSAIAIGLESGMSGFAIWRSHAAYLAINYHAAASLATLAASSGSRINFGAVGLVAPLLVLSYVAYREASTRADEAHRHITEVEGLYRASVEMLAIAVDAKDQVTHGHIRRVQRHTLSVAAGLGVTDARELKAIEAGALLHDIGKLAVPDYVLNKPSALTAAEFETMKKHASMGARILTAVEFPYPIVPIVRHHHERWDGHGYPDGLAGADIPIGARILAVVDCFDAVTSDRPYRARLTDDQAIDILRTRRGTFYDPAVVDKFIELIPELRSGDRSLDQHSDTHASVVAGLTSTRIEEPRDTRHDGSPLTVLADGPSIAELIEEHVARINGAAACLFAISPSRESLIVGHATPRIRSAVWGRQLPVGSGVSGWVAANRSAIRLAEAGLDLGEFADRFGLKSCVSIPVFVRADLFGVLTIYTADAAISEDTIETVGLLAQEVGLLIARGRSTAAQTRVRKPMHLSIVARS